VNVSGNKVFDWTNPQYSAAAWAAYQAAGLPSTAVTLYGNGEPGFLQAGSYNNSRETSFVGGFGRQSLIGGMGTNVLTYLSISDSLAQSPDLVNNFDPAKDFIDLSHIDANLGTLGLQSFTFIGTAPFTGAGAQVRYQPDPANEATYVEVALAGDSSPDLEVQLQGVPILTAANFALTPQQSAADLAAGAAMHISVPYSNATIASYTGVTGKGYSSFQAFYSNMNTRVADQLNLSSGSTELDLHYSNVTVTRNSSAESVAYGSITLPVTKSTNETIQASNLGGEAFVFGSGFGNETIHGFAAPGGATAADTLQFATSAFSYLNTGMTQAQDLAAVLAHAVSSASGTTISDSHGDVLTLAGLTPAVISANASQFKFA
jgi:hypothetical protein